MLITIAEREELLKQFINDLRRNDLLKMRGRILETAIPCYSPFNGFEYDKITQKALDEVDNQLDLIYKSYLNKIEQLNTGNENN